MNEWGRLDSGAVVRERQLARDPVRLLLLAGSTLLFVGSLLPWVSAFSDVVGRVAWTGVDGRGDGGILMFLGVLLAAFALWGRPAVEAWEPVRYVPLGLAALVVGDYVIAFRETSRLIEEGVGTGRLEIGLYIVGRRRPAGRARRHPELPALAAEPLTALPDDAGGSAGAGARAGVGRPVYSPAERWPSG